MLLEVARDPGTRLRDIAASIGVTERTVQGIVNDLHEAGYLTRERVGRRNRYGLNPELHFRYPTEAGTPVRRLIEIFVGRELEA